MGHLQRINILPELIFRENYSASLNIATTSKTRQAIEQTCKAFSGKSQYE